MTAAPNIETKERSPEETLALIEAAAAAGDNFYDLAVNAGMGVQEDFDRRKWVLGDLAGLVGKKYGKDILGTFAVAINVEKARLVEYRTVAAFWQKPARADILAGMPVVTYTHMRDAMRLKEPADALAFLEEVADNAWTVEQARIELQKRLGKPEPALKLVDVTTLSYDVNPADLSITMHIAPHIGLSVLKDLKTRRDARTPIRIVIFESK